MNLIKSSYEIIKQGKGLMGAYEMVEIAGRTCYKSEPNDAITAEGFANKMLKSGHTAMLEHGTVYLVFDTQSHPVIDKYLSNHYSKVVFHPYGTENKTYITTNLRVIAENDWNEDLQYLCEPTEYHAKRVTVRFICDRGISHEFVRHRVFSFAQESTRYCNYSKDKFNNEITFIVPSWLNLEEIREEFGKITFNYHKDINTFQSSEWSNCANFLQSLACCEANYLTLLFNQCKPQDARAVLPNALKTELVMTGFIEDWQHFFDLRALGTTGKPHPDAAVLAIPLMEDFKILEWI